MKQLTENQLEAAKIQHEIYLCVEWIKTVPKITTKINKDRSSYGYKHDVERYFGTYVCNDSFKAAAKLVGLKTIIQFKGSPNEFYNLDFVNNKNILTT